MPVGIQRLNAKKSHPNERIIFIKPLKGPTEKVAQDFLERIAAQCLPIMKDHHLSVMTLEEYEFNREFVGRNFNAGEVIQLVLKSRSGRWLPFEYVQMVMMHELAHCKQMNHSRAFWAVRNTYAEQMRTIFNRGYTGEGIWGRGAQLGTGAFETNTILPEDALPEHLCGGTYRSRRRKRKAKQPRLSYKEQKERRILKKFGAHGVSLGADDETKVKLEKGKKVQAKPRVAGSARGRELRAAAALARFETKPAQKEEEEDTKAGIKEEDIETASESEYEDDPVDIKAEDATDLDGQRLTDGHGRGMIKVCEDESPEDDDAQQELRELQNVKQWRQTRLNFGSVSSDSSSTTNDSTRGATATSPATKVQEEPEHSSSVAAVRVKEENTDDEGDALAQVPRHPPAQARAAEVWVQPRKRTRQNAEQEAPQPSSSRIPRIKDEPDESDEGQVSAAAPISPARFTDKTAPADSTLACDVCSFANPPLSITCSVCSNVLDPASVPNAWRCEGLACKGKTQYLNPGDFGVCGVCGQSRSK